MKFPVDAPKANVIKAFKILGFSVVLEGSHLIMERPNSDGTKTPLVLPNHRFIKSSTLRSILTQSGVERNEFLDAYSRT